MPKVAQAVLTTVHSTASALHRLWLPLRGPSAAGGHRQWVCLPAVAFQPAPQLPQPRVLPGQAHLQGGEHLAWPPRGREPQGSWKRETQAWAQGKRATRECRGDTCWPLQVFSQHPYAENFIGKPHVWTVDYNNSEEFEAAVKAIMKTQVRPTPARNSVGPHPASAAREQDPSG